ncbi:MAG: MFS transporter [Blastococcus sp.]
MARHCDPRRYRARHAEASGTWRFHTLIGIGLIDSVGTGLYLAGAAVYFTEAVGLSPARIGIGLSMAGLLGLLAQGPIGRLADRCGPRRVLLLLNLWRAVWFCGFLLVHDFTAFLIVAAMLGIGEQAAHPVYQALAERVVGPERRVGMMARLRVVYNVGFTAGGALAGVALTVGTTEALNAIMLGNAVSFAVAAALLPRVRLLPVRGSAPARTRSAGRRTRPLRDRRYVAVAAVNGVLSLHMTMLAFAVPLLVTTRTSAPHALVGVLLGVNTLMAVALQIRAVRGTDTVPGSATALRRAGICLGAACGIFAIAPLAGTTFLVVAFLVLGVVALSAGELLQSGGGWGLSYLLAPDWSRAEYLATFNLGTSLQFIAGPALLAVGVIETGPLGWAVLGVVLLLAGLAARPLARAAATRPTMVSDVAGAAADGRRRASNRPSTLAEAAAAGG